MITVKEEGDFSKTYSFLERAKHAIKFSTLDKYGRKGVSALKEATPKDTGLTAASWEYDVEMKKDGASLNFYNTNIQYDNRGLGVKVAVVIQMGHATRSGSWVEGIDYINPALAPIFQKVADDIWREVTDD